MTCQSRIHLHLHNNLHRRPRPKRAARPLRCLNLHLHLNLNPSPNPNPNPSFRPSHHRRNRNRNRRHNLNPNHSRNHSHSRYSPSCPHVQPQRQSSLVRLHPRAQRPRNLPRSRRRRGRLAMGRWALRHQLPRPCNLRASLHLSMYARTTALCRVRRPNHRIRLLRPMSPPMV